MSKKLILFSGGMDSLAIMIEYKDKYGVENIISLGINYGQRHFGMENKAADSFCRKFGIKRVVLGVDIAQIGGCSLVDRTKEVTKDMTKQRSTVVPQRNAIFLLFAAAYAQENDCDTIVHGACLEDEAAYRDCREVFFRQMEIAIQAGRTQPIKGDENILDDLTKYGELPANKLDIKIETPLIDERKEETLKRIVDKYGVGVYEDSYTCYNGGEISCGECPACVERLNAFKANSLKDPLNYSFRND